MAVQTNVSFGRVLASAFAKHWMFLAIGVVVLINLAMLVWYQHYLAVDFPVQDEIGYINRLHHLPQTGFLHYLFDPYSDYFIPAQFFIWYDFYTFAHLNIMVVRYTGAVINALASLLLCVMLYRKATSVNWLTLLVIVCAPFMICSYNNWASYGQSIEAVVEPLMFGSVLLLAWIAEKISRVFQEYAPLRKRLLWIGLFVITWLFATGLGPPPLVLLLAIVGARLLLERRFDRWGILLGVAAVAVPVLYVMLGKGLNQGFSASHSALGLKEVFGALAAAVGLVGNSLYSPFNESEEYITLLLAAGVLISQAVAIGYVLRRPPDERSRFMIPLTLTLYSWLVLLEMIGARLHEPDLAFTPRYSWFGLYAPVSLLFWFVMLSDSVRWKKVFGAAALVFMTVGIVLADAQRMRMLPYMQNSVARGRATFVSVQGNPTPAQLVTMFVNRPLRAFVYPDIEFLRERHLALFEGTGKPLAILANGPATINARTPFNVQRDGGSAVWIQINQPADGKVYIVINGTKLPAHVRDDLVAVEVPPRLYSKPGTYKMYVLEIILNRSTTSKPVDFIVH